MKKYHCMFLLILAIFLLMGCHAVEPEYLVTETTQPTVTLPPETEPTISRPTEPIHSEFYLPGVSVEDVILYFNEVCLNAEFINSGDPSLLQKWTVPILYTISGDVTSDDLAVFSDFVAWLNVQRGFPGMREADDPEQANLRIYFCNPSEMIFHMGDGFESLDGAVTFWYDYNEIYDAVICYRSDIPQFTRNSVILEELYNGLGPIQDTSLRQDSIIYSEFSEPQQLSEMDELILRLLYHPSMVCGMDMEACELVIRQLYK